MKKKEFGPQPMLWPHPTVLVGAHIDGKPDFAAVAWTGVAAGSPPCVTIGLQPHRYSLKGIYQNRAFSVNIPSSDLVKETDYCGLVSGKDTDKVKDCKFKVFYGTLDNAPLIEGCPVNMECEVIHLLNVGIHMLVIGRIVQTHVNEDCLSDGQPDILKIKPFVYSRGPTARYNAVGEVLGQAFDAGKKLKE